MTVFNVSETFDPRTGVSGCKLGARLLQLNPEHDIRSLGLTVSVKDVYGKIYATKEEVCFGIWKKNE